MINCPDCKRRKRNLRWSFKLAGWAIAIAPRWQHHVNSGLMLLWLYINAKDIGQWDELKRRLSVKMNGAK